MNSNKLIINLSDNKEVREYLASKGVGEKCVFEVVASLDETAPDHAVMSIKDITVIDEGVEPEAEEDGEGTEGEVELGKDEPPPAVMVALGVKRKGSGEAEY